VPQDGQLGSDVPSPEATVWRLDAIGGEEVAAVRTGEYAVRRVVADLTLDKQMLPEM
jgi:hypothetical protein